MDKDRDVYQEWIDKTKEAKVEYEKRSITDLINLYNKKRLLINPSYQRYYRWKVQQKSKLIESIMLGYPIPPIFMFRNKDKRIQTFEVIDGLQRLATILEFTGHLKEEMINKDEIFTKLTKTEEFNLEGLTWEDFEKNGLDFAIDASSLLIIYVDNPKSESEDLELKYEIFRRLNSSSTKLSDQEVRNSILAETDPESYKKLEKNISVLGFKFLSKADKEERKELELFLVFSLIKECMNNKEKEKEYFSCESYSEILDKYSFKLTKEILEANIDDFFVFMNMVDYFEFKKYDQSKNKYTGGFINLYFEILVTIYFNKKTWVNETNIKNTFNITYDEWRKSHGIKNVNPKIRLKKAIEWGREIANEQ